MGNTEKMPEKKKKPESEQNFEKREAEKFGQRLALARMRAGMTQVALAEGTGFVQSQIALFERGGRIPSDKLMDILAKAVCVTSNELRYGDKSSSGLMKEDYGAKLIVHHISGSDADHVDADIAKIMQEHGLSKDGAEVIADAYDAVYFAEHPEEAQAKIDAERAAFKKEMKNLRKGGSSADAVAEIFNMQDLFPDLFTAFHNGDMTWPEAYSAMIARILKDQPDMQALAGKGIINKPVDEITDEDREKNAQFIMNELIPAYRRLIGKPAKKRGRKARSEGSN